MGVEKYTSMGIHQASPAIPQEGELQCLSCILCYFWPVTTLWLTSVMMGCCSKIKICICSDAFENNQYFPFLCNWECVAWAPPFGSPPLCPMHIDKHRSYTTTASHVWCAPSNKHSHTETNQSLICIMFTALSDEWQKGGGGGGWTHKPTAKAGFVWIEKKQL